MKKLISFLWIAASILVFGAEPFQESSFVIPDNWKPKVILGRDFWMFGHILIFRGDDMTSNPENCIAGGDAFYPLKKASPGIQKIAAMPAFYDTAKLLFCSYDSTRKNPDGTYRFKLPPIPEHKVDDYPIFLLGSLVTRATMIGRDYNPDKAPKSRNFKRVAEQVHMFNYGVFNTEVVQEYRRKNPNFLAIIGASEWYNEAHSYMFDSRYEGAVKWNMLTPEQAEQIRREYRIEDKTFNGINLRAKKIFERGVKIIGDASLVSIFDGSSCVGHLAAYYGAGIIGCETWTGTSSSV